MEKNNLPLNNVKFEVALEILSMKIALTISTKDQKELEKLLIEQNKLYTYDEEIINKFQLLTNQRNQKNIKFLNLN